MRNKCQVCGAPCKSKFCSDECYKTSRRMKYRAKHPATETFYVFYDKYDFVRFCGTAKQLVEDKTMPSENAVHSLVSKIKSGRIAGEVVVLKCAI